MIAALVLSALVSSASPAPAWEPLACLYCEADEARSMGWSYERAQAGDDRTGWRDYIVPDEVRRHRFATQRECLRALRRALPVADHETDEAGQITTRTHLRDHVSESQSIPGVQSATALYGCFEHRAPTS